MGPVRRVELERDVSGERELSERALEQEAFCFLSYFSLEWAIAMGNSLTHEYHLRDRLRGMSFNKGERDLSAL